LSYIGILSNAAFFDEGSFSRADARRFSGAITSSCR